MGLSARLRIRLVAERRWIRLAPLYKRALGMDQLWMDVGIRIQLGLGAVPLWPLGIHRRRLVLGSGYNLGTRMGFVEIRAWLCRLGAAAAIGCLASRRWTRPL